MDKNYCVHPGAMMKSILTSMGKSQIWLATEMGMNKTIICDLFRGKRNVTANIAREFERATGFPAELLLQQQNKYDLFEIDNSREKRGVIDRYCGELKDEIIPNIQMNSEAIDIFELENLNFAA